MRAVGLCVLVVWVGERGHDHRITRILLSIPVGIQHIDPVSVPILHSACGRHKSHKPQCERALVIPHKRSELRQRNARPTYWIRTALHKPANHTKP